MATHPITGVALLVKIIPGKTYFLLKPAPSLRNRVIASLGKGITSQNSPKSKQAALNDTVLLHSLKPILAAGGKIRTFCTFHWDIYFLYPLIRAITIFFISNSAYNFMKLTQMQQCTLDFRIGSRSCIRSGYDYYI